MQKYLERFHNQIKSNQNKIKSFFLKTYIQETTSVKHKNYVNNIYTLRFFLFLCCTSYTCFEGEQRESRGLSKSTHPGKKNKKKRSYAECTRVRLHDITVLTTRDETV